MASVTIPSEADLHGALRRGRYALVGAGQLGAMSLAQWPDDVARPEFVLDSVKTGDLSGVEIRPLLGHVRDPGVTYLLSAFKMPPAAIRDIFARIGQPDILTVYDLFEEYTPVAFTNGWRNVTPSADVRAALARLPDFYADEISRQICDAVTAWRYRRELVDNYPVGPEEIKYDLSRFGRAGQHYDIVYDGGAYDLGLLASLTRAGIGWDRVVAFEPDPASQSLCRAHRAQWEQQGGAPVTLDTRALSNRAGRSPFIANGLLSSRMVGEGALTHADLIDVETCRLDDVHRALFGDTDAPSRILIKLHIEGAELAALQGAADLLARHDVDILLNLSHDEQSWLDIPAYLAGFGRFDLYLRSHALFGEGLTVFARNRA